MIAQGSQAAYAGDWDGFLSDGDLLANLRYRYEFVEQDGFAKNAIANTVRARLGLQTAKAAGIQALIEIEANGQISNRFNDTVNGKAIYPVIPDPENLEINRLQISFDRIEDTTVVVGRQEINLDDQRFVGAVAFRQNEQTFDAFRIDNTSLPGMALTYINVNRVNRVFGERSSQGYFEGSVHLLNAGYDLKRIGRLSAYAYLLKLDNVPALSTTTYGVSLAGKQGLGDSYSLTYRAEAAAQHDYGNNPRHFSLGYLRGESGLSSGIWSLSGGVEYLEGNGSVGFSTPLATLHKFQGFADVFLTTPASGIADSYVKAAIAKRDLSWSAATGVSLSGWYHNFDNPRGGSLGSEFDAELAVSWGAHTTTSIAYASYSGNGGYASRDKLWLNIEFVR